MRNGALDDASHGSLEGSTSSLPGFGRVAGYSSVRLEITEGTVHSLLYTWHAPTVLPGLHYAEYAPRSRFLDHRLTHGFHNR
jgi:hypothetical protein